MQNSIIVYSNPIEQQMWEGTIYGMPTIFFCILFAVAVVGLWLIGYILWNNISRWNNRRRNHYNRRNWQDDFVQ